MSRPVLFTFYNSDHDVDELLPLAHITAVVRSDVGGEDERLIVVSNGRSSYTNSPDTIRRFFEEWDIR